MGPLRSLLVPKDSNGSLQVLRREYASFSVLTRFCNTLRILMGLYRSLKVFVRAYETLWVVFVSPYASLCAVAPNKNNKNAQRPVRTHKDT